VLADGAEDAQDCQDKGCHRRGRGQHALTLRRIGDIYTARLPNVDWGTVELPNLLKVTRIGFMLERAILANMITREKALADVRQGENTIYFAWHFTILVRQYGAVFTV
jgi:hypothetical protein